MTMKGMLSCKGLHQLVQGCFSRIKDNPLRSRTINLTDNLMAGFAVCSLKYPSLLQFDQHSQEAVIRHNLETVFQIKNVPSDTPVRERLDEVAPEELRRTYKTLFALCQRSKHLELFKFHQDRYLMPLDGTGYFYSKEPQFGV